MSRTVYTYNEFHLGDNLIFLHLLRSLAKSHVSTPFVHFCHAHYHDQLKEVVEDLPNILLEPFQSSLWSQHRHHSVDTWKNAEQHWEKSPVRWDWSAHALEHHRWTAQRMGFESPFSIREHLLFDYPALEKIPIGDVMYDFLIGDSKPSSGQYSEGADHSINPLSSLNEKLLRAGKSIMRTEHAKECGDSITRIGGFSQSFTNHIMVASGPFWPTLNVHNHHNHEGRKRIVLLDNGEQLNMPHIIQCANVGEVMEIAKQEGWVN